MYGIGRLRPATTPGPTCLTLIATLCVGSAGCATVQVLQVLAWEGCPASRAYTPYLSCQCQQVLSDLKTAWRSAGGPLPDRCSITRQWVRGGPGSAWVPGWLATFDSCNPNGAPSAGASLCPADRLVWSFFSISTISPFVYRVRLDTLLPRRLGLLSASTGTQRCVEFPLAGLYHANAPAMYLPRVRQGGCPTISGADRFDNIRGKVTGFDSAGHHPDGKLPILQMILFA
ncbi:uncharacterized protein K444DRAFT_23938 [Hyaloscypha bicolor E]|uniref:Uncharacterized protein n=1 Tax=Hyaloscypha bicolor E TaxID=1095630 RepID=A0A2J6T435_9HELO|nr:uncharacterized protein K444DRAFT_23938 [Hyaloscypha bicolor E]PMD57772.1 hypothetical protein K444DRAFT_23938 [Hyaloscypha bicolor E]